jgi:hypothetical protein
MLVFQMPPLLRKENSCACQQNDEKQKTDSAHKYYLSGICFIL